jgi:hypothetical protein
MKYSVGEMVVMSKLMGIPRAIRGKEVTITGSNDEAQTYTVTTDDGDDYTVRAHWIYEDNRVIHKSVDNIPVTVDNSPVEKSLPEVERASDECNMFGEPIYIIDGERYELASWGEKLSDGSRWATLRLAK